MKTLADRVKQRMDDLEITQEQLGRMTGMSQTAIYKITVGETKEPRKILLLAQALKCQPEWLSQGIGAAPKSKELVSFESQPQSNISPAPDFVRNVPLISWVSAGMWCEAVDNYAPGDAEDWLPCITQCSKHSYALRVQGDSMTNPYPTGKSYPEGTIIYVDPEKPITNGCRVIAKLPNSNEATFKQYVEDGGKRYLKPLNPQYPMIEIGDDARLCRRDYWVLSAMSDILIKKSE
jgi:SOS-response transcriptional repressor LexA